MISIAGIIFLFGFSWLFGALTITIQELRLTFQVLFAIFSSLQGFFIFLFFCVFSKEARELWKETLSCGRYKSKFLNPNLRNNSTAVKFRKPGRNTSSTGTTSGNYVTKSKESVSTFQPTSSSTGSAIFVNSHAESGEFKKEALDTLESTSTEAEKPTESSADNEELNIEPFEKNDLGSKEARASEEDTSSEEEIMEPFEKIDLGSIEAHASTTSEKEIIQPFEKIDLARASASSEEIMEPPEKINLGSNEAHASTSNEEEIMEPFDLGNMEIMEPFNLEAHASEEEIMEPFDLEAHTSEEEIIAENMEPSDLGSKEAHASTTSEEIIAENITEKSWKKS